MLWKCCTQYARKFWKLNSGHRTGKGQFSFQSQRKAMPKNAQTTAQLHSSCTLLKKCSTFSRLGFNSMWTEKFQMCKLGLEKAVGPEIKLPTSVGSLKKQEFQESIYFCFIDYAKALDCVAQKQLWKILQEMGITGHLTSLLKNLYVGQEVTVITRQETMDRFNIGKGLRQGCILSPCLFNLCRVHHVKCWAGWSTNWNQDCWEKYQ